MLLLESETTVLDISNLSVLKSSEKNEIVAEVIIVAEGSNRDHCKMGKFP